MSSTQFALRIQAEHAYLLRFARARLRDHHSAEDLAQETLLAALKGAPRFEQRSSLRTWLTGILKHKIIDLQRRGGRELNISALLDDSEFPDVDSLVDDDSRGTWPAAEWGDPVDQLERKQFLRCLHACLEKLPPNQQRAFVLREMLDRDSDEICRMLGVTTGNLWVMLHRARAALRQSLAESHGFALGVR